MGILAQILAGFGLSAASGLNAYIPLLVVGILGRFTPWLKLSPPFDILTNEWVIAVLVILEFIEIFVDKIPGLDHLNDIIQTIIRPTAGAILFAAQVRVISDLHPATAFILGLIVAFGVHATKATIRPAVTVGTLGTGNWLVSILEDILSLVMSLLALLAPVLLVFLFILLFWLVLRWRSRRKQRHPSAGTTPPLKWPR